MKYLFLFLVWLSVWFSADSQPTKITAKEVEQILSETMIQMQGLQGAVIITDIDGYTIASAYSDGFEYSIKHSKDEFMAAVDEFRDKIGINDCHREYSDLLACDCIAEGVMHLTDTEGNYLAELTAYYPAENPQYRIFSIMETQRGMRQWRAVPINKQVVQRIINILSKRPSRCGREG